MALPEAVTVKAEVATKAAEVVSHALPTAVQAPTDPLLIMLGWVLAIVLAVLLIAVPIRDYLRRDKRESGADKVADAMSGAGSVMYEQITEQLRQSRIAADHAYAERNVMATRIGRLEERDSQFDELKGSYERLKARLDEKDRKLEEKDDEIRKLIFQAQEERLALLGIIKQKDTEIASRDERILSLERGLNDLKLQLAQDDHHARSYVCPFAGQKKAKVVEMVQAAQNEGEGNEATTA